MNTQKRLVVSWNTYDWIHNLAGFIAKDPSSFEIIIIMKDEEHPMHWTKELCEEAIYAQRVHDLRCIGKQLGIKKLSNLLYTTNTFHLEMVAAKLQMHIVLSGIKEVYFQYNSILEGIFSAIKDKAKIEIYGFDGAPTGLEKIIYLSEEERQAKHSLLKYMVALPHYQLDYNDKEYLYKI